MTAVIPLQKPFQHWMVFETWGVLFLCLDHSLTLVGLRYRLYKQQTAQNSSASPAETHKPAGQKSIDQKSIARERERTVKWETCRTQDRCKTMTGKVLLPLTEFQNRIPKCHWSCSWKQLHVCFLPPFPFQTDYTPTEQQPRVQRQGRFLLSYTNHADNLQELGSLSEVTEEGTPPIKNTGISHSNWEQLCVPLASVQHPQSPVSIDSTQWREQPAYSQQCKLLTKPMLLAGYTLCTLPSLYLQTSRDWETQTRTNTVFHFYKTSHVLQ